MNSDDKAGKRVGGRVTAQVQVQVCFSVMGAATEGRPRRALHSVHDGHHPKALRKDPQDWVWA